MASQDYAGPGRIDGTGRGQLVLHNGPDALPELHRFLAAFTTATSLPTDMAQAVDLALTEWVTNVLSYGFSPDETGVITLALSGKGSELQIEVEDTGPPFNPLAYPLADVNRPLEEKPIGGLGIHLVRGLMDELHYNRTNRGNRLLMIKRLGP